MSDFHQLKVTLADQSKIESVSPEFIKQGLIRARDKTVQVLHEIKNELKIGMTEDDARHLCLDTFKKHGVTKHWHRPYVRFGSGTVLTFNHPVQAGVTLQANDPYYLDLGPVWPDPELGLEYEGDYGDTFILGDNPEAEKCANTARELFTFIQNKWREQKLSGEAIYALLQSETKARGYELDPDVEGHRMSDFPHQRYSKEHLARVPFIPSDALWVLEVKINHPSHAFGAFFEDIL